MAMPARVRGLLWFATVCILLGGCAHSPARESSATTAPGGSDLPHAHREHRPYSDQNLPPRRGGDFVVKELLLSRDVRDADGQVLHPDEPGLEFWAEEVRTCVRRSSHHRELVGWDDWRAKGTDGRVYPARPAGAHPLPTPTYPFRKVLAPGQCVTGWWLIPVPKLPGGPTAIQFAPGGRTLIDWPTLR
ncbi:hypothetical protein [Nocardioides sp. URHA0032]|uniref:hypothetical protein n=1 Tax=Nocardioides sp. URHA0032 TaxID=1380388 RepID=UPI00048ACFFA|nr:hypothetical protein [Nocardioides sp. URHA0032]